MSIRPAADRVAIARHALRVANAYLPKEVQVEIEVLLSVTNAEDEHAKALRKALVRTLHRWQNGEGDGHVCVGREPHKMVSKDGLRGRIQELCNTLGAIERGDLELVRAAESYFGEDYE